MVRLLIMKSDSYFEFEDRFRGPRYAIKSRLSSYDGLINYISNNIDSPKSDNVIEFIQSTQNWKSLINPKNWAKQKSKVV